MIWILEDLEQSVMYMYKNIILTDTPTSHICRYYTFLKPKLILIRNQIDVDTTHEANEASVSTINASGFEDVF